MDSDSRVRRLRRVDRPHSFAIYAQYHVRHGLAKSQRCALGLMRRCVQIVWCSEAALFDAVRDPRGGPSR